MKLLSLVALAALGQASCSALRPTATPSGLTVKVYLHQWDRCLAGCEPYKVIAAVEFEDEEQRVTMCRCTSGEKLYLTPEPAKAASPTP